MGRVALENPQRNTYHGMMASWADNWIAGAALPGALIANIDNLYRLHT